MKKEHLESQYAQQYKAKLWLCPANVIHRDEVHSHELIVPGLGLGRGLALP